MQLIVDNVYESNQNQNQEIRDSIQIYWKYKTKTYKTMILW